MIWQVLTALVIGGLCGFVANKIMGGKSGIIKNVVLGLLGGRSRRTYRQSYRRRRRLGDGHTALDRRRLSSSLARKEACKVRSRWIRERETSPVFVSQENDRSPEWYNNRIRRRRVLCTCFPLAGYVTIQFVKTAVKKRRIKRGCAFFGA